jgi:hypothetical protein
MLNVIGSENAGAAGASTAINKAMLPSILERTRPMMGLQVQRVNR